jgi:hypothetical protein
MEPRRLVSSINDQKSRIFLTSRERVYDNLLLLIFVTSIHDIDNYIPEINHVSWVYNAADVIC